MGCCTVPMFYRTVVLKKGNVICRSFDSKDLVKLIIHFYGHFTHAVFDAAAFKTDIIAIAHG